MILQIFKKPLPSILLLAFLTLIGCQKTIENDPSNQITNTTTSIQELNIPENFDYNSEHIINLNVTSSNSFDSVIYEIYMIDYDGSKVSKGHLSSDKNGALHHTITIPKYIDKLHIIKYQQGGSFKEEVTFNNQNINVSFDSFSESVENSSNGRKMGCNDKFYAANSAGNLYEINIENDFSYTQQADMSNGTFAMAVDKSNGKIYFNDNNKLFEYNLSNSTTSVVATNGSVGWDYVKMAYHTTSGRLFIGSNAKLKIVNTNDYSIYRSLTVTGFNTTSISGGDLAFTSDGTLYNVCSSGLYRYTFNSDSTTCTAIRISADNFPYSGNGLSVDRFNNLYISANESTTCKIIKMDPKNGSYIEVKTLPFKINDLGNYFCTTSELPNIDTDNDGIIDGLDAFPNNADKAYNNYSPSSLGYSTIAFEDLYPNEGDYDFNDLMVNFRYNFITNSSNEVVEIDASYIFKYVDGAELNNGFGVSLPFSADSITNVTGSFLTTGLIIKDTKGLESGHSAANPTFIVFDNSYGATNGNGSLLKSDPINIVIDLSDHPISLSSITSEIPFNPFIFINKDRSKEVHLPNKAPTIKFDTNFRSSGDDAGNYKTSGGHPWAIYIPHKFHPPVEGTDITNSYTQFSSFATSGGTADTDWYNDDTGHRNISNIVTDDLD